MTEKQRTKASVYMALLLVLGIINIVFSIPFADDVLYPGGSFLNDTYLIPVADIFMRVGMVISLISGFALVLILLRVDKRS